MGLTVTCARCHDHKYDPIPTADYYSLYGVFAGSEDPIIPPLVGPVANDPKTAEFQRELEARVQALDEYEPKQYAALIEEFRTRAGDYLLQALNGRLPPQQPLPTPAGAIRQLVVERWIEYIERAGADHPVFGAWNAFAGLKRDAFATEAQAVVERWGEAVGSWNRLVMRRFVDRPPSSMVEVAKAYGELLGKARQDWQDVVASTAAAGAAVPERLSDGDLEQLRDVLYAIDSPVAVPRQEALWEYLYDAPINNEITKRRNAINQHLAQTALAPPRAHTLVELPLVFEPRILVRGNPTRPGKLVPRQFLEVLSPAERKPFTLASGRLELARAVASRDNPLTRPRDREPSLGAPLRRRPGPHAQQLRPARPAAHVIRNCSTTWQRGSWTRAGRSRNCTA